MGVDWKGWDIDMANRLQDQPWKLTVVVTTRMYYHTSLNRSPGLYILYNIFDLASEHSQPLFGYWPLVQCSVYYVCTYRCCDKRWLHCWPRGTPHLSCSSLSFTTYFTARSQNETSIDYHGHSGGWCMQPLDACTHHQLSGWSLEQHRTQFEIQPLFAS